MKVPDMDERANDTPGQKHALHTPWVLSFAGQSHSRGGSRNSSRNDWKEGKHLLPGVAFAEDLWAQWARVVPPSKWPPGTTAYLFRDGLEPSWEAWPSGGAWTLSLDCASVPANQVDTMWLHLAMAAVGEQLSIDVPPAELCGAELAVRRTAFRLSCWTRSADDECVQRAVLRRLRIALKESLPADVARGCTWQYFAHHERRRQMATSRSGDRRQRDTMPALYVDPIQMSEELQGHQG